MKNNVKKKRIIKVLLILISVVCLVLIYTYLNKNIGFEIPCIFHKFTGLYCPGCGITRMIFSIFELNFYQAFRYNPLIFIFFPFLILYCIYEIVIYINNKKDTLILKIPKGVTITLLVITIAYGILRNFDMFSYLRPTIIK